MIEIKAISKSFSDKKVLGELDYKFGKGLHLITGCNGSGKTTLLKILTLILKPNQGTIHFNREAVTQKNKLFLNKVSVAFSETTSFFQHLTAYENLDFFAALNNQQIDFEEFSTNYPEVNRQYLGLESVRFHKYSSGMQKKLNLLRALMLKSEILILDEPFTHLDEKACLVFKNHFEVLAKNKIILIATHRKGLFSPGLYRELELTS